MELNAILLHELAHLRRRDDWTNLVQKVVGALLFFHPAVWWIEKKLALEREMACDDMVLAQTSSPRAYAECLVSLAEKSFLRRGLALAQAAVDRLRNVSLRVTQILDVNRPRATRVWGPAPALVAGVSLACLVALSHAPTRLVSFEKRVESPAVSECDRTRRFRSEPDVADGGTSRSREDFSSDPKMRIRRVRARWGDPVAVAAKASGIRSSRTKKPEVIPARAVQRRATVPMLVRSSMASDGVAPQTMFLVMQTEFVQTRQYDATGAVVWDLCVWRVTVVGPVQK